MLVCSAPPNQHAMLVCSTPPLSMLVCSAPPNELLMLVCSAPPDEHADAGVPPAPQPGRLEPSFAAIDISSERLVSDVLTSASKPLPVHRTSSYSARGE